MNQWNRIDNEGKKLYMIVLIQASKISKLFEKINCGPNDYP